VAFLGEFCAFKNDYLGRPFDFPFFFRERFLQLFVVPFGLPEGDFPGRSEKRHAGPMRKERRKRRRRRRRRRSKTCLTYAYRWVVEVI
jgi:hypothetical protein